MSCAAVASWLGRLDQASPVSFQPPPAPYRAGPSFVPSVVDVMRSFALDDRAGDAGELEAQVALALGNAAAGLELGRSAEVRRRRAVLDAGVRHRRERQRRERRRGRRRPRPRCSSAERLPAASSALTVYSYVVCGSTVVSEKLVTLPVVAQQLPVAVDLVVRDAAVVGRGRPRQVHAVARRSPRRRGPSARSGPGGPRSRRAARAPAASSRPRTRGRRSPGRRSRRAAARS